MGFSLQVVSDHPQNTQVAGCSQNNGSPDSGTMNSPEIRGGLLNGHGPGSHLEQPCLF